MKFVNKWNAKLMLVLATASMLSACAATEERPRTVSDFCLNAKRITSDVEPQVGAEDAEPGNQYDTDDTVFQTYAHNATIDRLCPAV